MNKKSLAKKIFNFKKNKKNISEEWKDESLGHLQSALSTVSAVAAAYHPRPSGHGWPGSKP